MSHADTGTTDMKHIKQDSISKALVHTLGELLGWGRGQNSTFSEYGHVTYQFKENDECSNVHVQALFCP